MKVNAVIEMSDDKKSYVVSFSNGEVIKVLKYKGGRMNLFNTVPNVFRWIAPRRVP